MQVFVRDNNVEQALRALKRKMQREGVFREMKRRKAYEKPSERRTREKAEAIRRVRKAAQKQAQRDGLIPMPKRREDARRSVARPRSFLDFCSDSLDGCSFLALATRKSGGRKAPGQWSWSTAISSTSSTIRCLSFAFLIRIAWIRDIDRQNFQSYFHTNMSHVSRTNKLVGPLNGKLWRMAILA